MNRVLKEEVIEEIVEKKSRFICRMKPVSNEEEALDYIKSVKKECYDARHNCYAYIIGPNKEIFHSSDDGEPSGTAGRPMLEVIENEGLYNVVAVVTRYFGGVLLGTGGLVRAYQGATKKAINAANIVSVVAGREFSLALNYSDWGKAEHFFKEENVIVSNIEYGQDVSLEAIALEGKEENLSSKITEITSGTSSIEWGSLIMVEI